MQLLEPVDWNMGEFFVLAKFQGQGVGSQVAKQIVKEHPGKWSVAVMPENIYPSPLKVLEKFSEMHYKYAHEISAAH